MRLLLLSIAIALPALALVWALYWGSRLKRFCQTLASIDSRDDLELFKRAVGRQMYASLVVIALVTIAAAVYVVGLFLDALSWKDLLYVLVLVPLYLIVAVKLKGIEQRVRSMPASDAELERERDRVVHVWNHKAFPDW